MIPIAGYCVLEELYLSSATVVVRARRDRDGLPVVLKLLRGEYPTPEAVARLRREYAILSALDIPEVVRAVALEPIGGTFALVLEDTAGEPVDEVARRATGDPLAFLRLAIAIARAVAAVHARGIVHKDLKPQHLRMDPAGTVRILDFGISSELAQEGASAIDPDSLEGTLAYIAPEQTGRMGQPVDRRSDLYALGVTLFELATGQLPFRGRDPLELVHCHIARTPPRADVVDPRVPAGVGAILGKLMAKDPQDRYQSAPGLLADLEQALATLTATGALEPFELGTHDQVDTLRLPPRLYGRADAVAVLHWSLELARGGEPRLLLVRGPSGVGKSALVHSLRRELVLRGQLVSGHFDPLTRGEPYSALANACRELVRGLLSAPPETLAERRRALLDALGGNARLIVDRVPELERAIGPQPEPPPLPPTEARHRFERTFEAFVGALLPADEPVVLFLDDLQWADTSSLRLLGAVLTGTRPLLMIGAYRDEEVDDAHPLAGARAALEARGVPVTSLALGPLGEDAVTELLADTLGRTAPDVRLLARTLLDKTGGNPFHLGQYLQGLARDGLIVPAAGGRHWSFDLAAIERHRAAGNVVELLIERLSALPAEPRHVLGVASCFGNEVDWRTLVRVAGLEPRALAESVLAALREDVLVPLDEHYRYLEQPGGGLHSRFRFAHDRLKQAAYALIEPEWRAIMHLRLGHLLRAALPDDADGESLRAAVEQLNLGASCLTDPADRDWLVRMNLRLANEATAAGATAIAHEHATHVLAVLGDEPWEADPTAAFAARMRQAECEFVSGAPERALAVLDDVDAHAAAIEERVAAANLRTTTLVRLGRLRDATRVSVEALRRLGHPLPDPDDAGALQGAIGAEFAAVQAAIAGRDVDALVALPELADARKRLELETLAVAIPAAYQSVPALMVVIVLRGTSLTLAHGATDRTAFFLAQYAIALKAVTGDHLAPYRFGRLGLEVGRAPQHAASLASAHFLFAGFLSHWVEPIARSLEHFALGLRRGLESGDLLHASYCVGLSAQHLMRSGLPLPEVSARLPESRALLERMDDRVNPGLLDVCERTIAALSGECAPFGPVVTGGLEDPVVETRVTGPQRYWLQAARMQTRFLAGRPADALAADGPVDGFVGLAFAVDLELYRGLAHAALARETAGDVREEHLRALRAATERFAGWAEGSAAGHAHRRDLLAAELAELEGDPARALDRHESAIEGARALGLVHEHALASERCGEYHLRAGHVRLARAALGDALRAWRAWGATGKADELLARHAGLSLEPAEPARAPHERTTSVARQSHGSAVGRSGSAALDLESMMRATQAIASELAADRLLARLVRILVENAGAQRGVLAAPRGEDLVVEAEHTVEPDAVHLSSTPLADADAPGQLMRYVARTHEPVVIGDTGTGLPHAFAGDPYLRERHPRSVLCVALMFEGRLGAVAYLEHRTAAHAFSPARVERIRFLAVQAASALANSRLYEALQASNREMEQRVRERTLELSQRNRDLRGVFDAVRQGLLTVDRAGRVVGERSAAAAAWLGPVAEGDALEQVLAQADPEFARGFGIAYEQVVHGEGPLAARLERVPRRLTAGPRTLALELRPVGDESDWTRMLVVISDVSDEERRQRLEVELRHAQKLESVGQLAAGIAHEINTPAQFVGDSLAFMSDGYREVMQVLDAYREALGELARRPGFGELAARLHEAEDDVDLPFLQQNLPPAFERARDGLTRISTLVRAMKEFAHPGRHEKDHADLDRAIRNTITVARNELKFVADVEEELGAIPLVKCHLSDMNQVFLNLLVNAAHAIRDVVGDSGTRGRIRVRSERIGDSVRITIADTGGGIPAAIRDRVFDPFFTTKPVGQGTGQGLAIARSIVVDKHGGTLTFESEPGRGTTFVIELPIEGAGEALDDAA